MLPARALFATLLLLQTGAGWTAPGCVEGNADPLVHVKLLAINDLHGHLSAGRMLDSRPIGSAAVLAAYLRHAAADAQDGAIIVHAGDAVGGTPPASALLQDEPTIAVLNELANAQCRYVNVKRGPSDRSYRQPRCNVVGTLGNHEFDEGLGELVRLLDGGKHRNGPFLENPWRGARYPTISANVVDARTGRTVLAPFSVREVHGVRVGFIGAVVRGTPTIVTPAGVAGVRFLDEAESINRYAKVLRDMGVRTIVVTIHEGIRQTSYEGRTRPEVTGLSGPIVDIVRRLDDEVDLVISGHTHAFTNALIPNARGVPILVTQAFSFGTAYGDIDLAISRCTQDVVDKSAAIVRTWADAGPGLSPDAPTAALVAAAEERVAPLVDRVVGIASADITRDLNPAGESALGNLVADAQRLQTGSQFAFMNADGIRDSLHAGDITWGRIFTVQPFSNDLVSMDLTGAQVRVLLEQQWLDQPEPVALAISGLSYKWNAAAPVGSRVVEIRDAGGNLLSDAATYRVTVNSFMAAGGDNFVVLNQGTRRVVGAIDRDALIAHITGLAQPFNIGIEGRSQRQN